MADISTDPQKRVPSLSALQRYVKVNRLKEALGEARALAIALGDSREIDRFSALDRAYSSMIRYMSTDSDTGRRDADLAGIREALARFIDKVRLRRRLRNPQEGREADIYYAAVRTQTYSSGPSTATLVEEMETALAPEARYDAADALFTHIFAMLHLENETEELRRALRSDDPLVRTVVATALLVANLYWYDADRLSLLAEASFDDEPEVAARALTGVYLTLWRHADRVRLSTDIAPRLRLLADDAPTVAALRHMSLAFLRSRDTERLSRKMSDDILPALQRLRSDMQKRFAEGMPDMGELLNPEKNPEWEDMLERSGLQESLRELGDAQTEGGDVMMMALGAMKGFPFFRRPMNWLLPYDPDHPALKEARGINARLVDRLADGADFICDADRYSLAFGLQRMPQGASPRMLDQLGAMFDQYREERDTSVVLSTRPALHTHITMFVRDLYRLVHLFPKSQLDLPDPFRVSVIPSDFPWLGALFDNETSLAPVAAFLFERGYYNEALPVLKRLALLRPDDAQLLEQQGYAALQNGDSREALRLYVLAETLSATPSKWLLRQLATLYRAAGDHRRAARYFRRLYDADPDNPKKVVPLANALYDSGDYAGALKLYYKADYLTGGSPRTWRPIAWCELLTGDVDKAALYYQKLLREDTPAAVDYLNMGHLHLSQGNTAQALDLYEKGARIHADGVEGFVRLLDEDAEILGRHGFDATLRAMLADRLRYALDKD